MSADLTLSDHYATISMEAHGDATSLQQAITRLPAFFKDVSHSLAVAFKAPFVHVFKAKDMAWAATVVEKYPYATLRTEEMPCVPGLTGDYLPYIANLHDAAVFAATIRGHYVQPFVDFLAKKLSNPDSLRSYGPDSSLATIDLAPIEAHTQALAGFTNAKADHATAPYGKLFKRHADWQPVVAQAQAIHAIFSHEDHHRFETAVERCKDLLSSLLTRLQQHPDEYQLSGPQLEMISKHAYIVATAVEFYGLVYHRANELDHALEKLVLKVKTMS